MGAGADRRSEQEAELCRAAGISRDRGRPDVEAPRAAQGVPRRSAGVNRIMKVDEAALTLQPSWPGLSRPSTSYFERRQEDVDARPNAGHDAEMLGALASQGRRP